MARTLDVFVPFLRLGCTSFGGPVAHLAYFREEFVVRRRWLDETTLAECIALTQLLPGPGSSQTGMLIGWIAAGPAGAVCAWIAFTLPSAVLMTAVALAGGALPAARGAVHGLLLVATAVVASAIVALRSSLAPDASRLAIVAATAIAAFVLPGAFAPLAIAAAAAAGVFVLYGRIETTQPKLDLGVSERTGLVCLAIFAAAFLAIEIAAASTNAHPLVLADVMVRVGSLVFGGGHVVLPLLVTQAVARGIVDGSTLLSGYAAAQAMPGPLFTIASFVGARAFDGALGVWGSIVATAAIFAPSFALLAGIAPFYRRLAGNERFRAALAGANAGVVGILAAAFVSPIWTSSVRTAGDVVAVAAAFFAIFFANAPAWAVVLAGAFFGYFFTAN